VLAQRAPAELARLLDGNRVATTNLFYARLCRRTTGDHTTSRFLDDLPAEMRSAIEQRLRLLPHAIVIVPMRDLAWRMAELAADFRGLSMLGAEAVAAAVHLDATLCVRDKNDGPGIRAAAEALGVPYVTITG
jgi:hypothetical protein